ncbi:MAG TPA: RNA polymerase sigma factor, partial [Gammaproteobacteria bacterium]|nr:RNA polymerase sigma factor [Gammaproteobacteria bacterium]
MCGWLRGAQAFTAARARTCRFDENLLAAVGHGRAWTLKGRQHDNLSGRTGAAGSAVKACTFNRRGQFLQTAHELNRFLADVERRAYRIAQMALRSHEDAQDAVQEAMFQLAKRYASRPQEEWPPLFYRILQSRIRDTQRRRAVRNRVLSFFGGQRGDGDDELPDPIASAPDPAGVEPGEQVAQAEAMVALEKALGELPGRQREAFVLRILEGLDVAQTAQA